MTEYKIPHLRPMSEKPEKVITVFIKLEDGRQVSGFFNNGVRMWFAHLDLGFARPIEGTKALGWCYPEDLVLPPPPPELPKVTTGRELMELSLEYAAAGKKLKVRVHFKKEGVDPVVHTLVLNRPDGTGLFWDCFASMITPWLDQDLATVEVLPDEEGDE